MRPIDFIDNIAFLHIRLICDMEVRFSSNITPRLRASFVTASTVGYKKKNNKQWLTPETWEKVEERKHLKIKMLNAKSPRLQQQAQQLYAFKDREVKKSARKDKRHFIEELACKAELAASRGELSTVYKVTKQLCGNFTSHPPPVRAKDGSPLTSEREQTARWVQHFQEVLNQPEPDQPASPDPPQDILDIDVSPPTPSEVRKAIKATKNGRAPGPDSIHAEMLQAELDISTTVLVDLFSYIWDTNTIPCDWTNGLIVKIPKKGNLQNCVNWRGITLLSLRQARYSVGFSFSGLIQPSTAGSGRNKPAFARAEDASTRSLH